MEAAAETAAEHEAHRGLGLRSEVAAGSGQPGCCRGSNTRGSNTLS